MELWRNVWAVFFSEMNDLVAFLTRPFCMWNWNAGENDSDMDGGVMDAGMAQLKSCTLLLWETLTPSWIRRGLQKTFMKIVERNVEKAVRGYASTVKMNVMDSVRESVSDVDGSVEGRSSGVVVSWFVSWFGGQEGEEEVETSGISR